MTTNKGYFVIDSSNTAINLIVLDSDIEWAPTPEHPYYDCTMVPQETTPGKRWTLDIDTKDWVLTEALGSGDIGDVWDGTRLTTTKPKPPPLTSPAQQPTVTGAQTL